MMDSKNAYIKKLGHYLAYLYQYRSIYNMLIEKDLKGRFKYTILGYFWHLLNPLTQIIIYYAIFTVIFGRDIPNYWVYMSVGMFAFGYFMASSSGGCGCIIANTGMITKMAMAREIIPFSKVSSNLITLLISYTLLILLMIILNVGATVNLLYVPGIILLLTLFNCGMNLILSALVVYLRDIQHAVTILFGCLMFATPIFYLSSQVSNPTLEMFWKVNPMYYYVETLHDTMYYGIVPDEGEILACLFFGITVFVIGLAIFKKLEPGFAERL